MSAAVKPEGSGGIDLSKLTNGERFLIGWLDNQISTGLSEHAAIGGLYESTGYYLNLSAVSSINVKATQRGGSVGGYVEVRWGSSGSANVNFSMSAAGTVKTLDLSSVQSSNLRATRITLNNFSGSSVVCDSFTTTDGKVHTAANLNY